MLEANKALGRRYFEEILNQSNLSLVDELFAGNAVFHAPHIPAFHSPEARKMFVTAIHASYPNAHYTVEEVIAEGDKVVVRWTFSGTHIAEHAVSGKPALGTGTTTLRIQDGKIMEEWVDYDALGLWQQLGVIPPLGQSRAKAGV